MSGIEVGPGDEWINGPTRKLIRSFTSRFTEEIHDTLGVRLAGVVLHGSAADGDFRPGSSDLDLFVMVEDPLDLATKSALVRRVWSMDPPDAARGLEVLVVSRAAMSGRPAWGDFEVVASPHPSGSRIVEGPNDASVAVVVLLAHARTTGEAFWGGPIETLIPPIPTGPLLVDTARFLRWSLDHTPESFVVLTACRGRAHLATGDFWGKERAGEWALHHGIEPGLVDRALAARRGAKLDRPPSREAGKLALSTVALLQDHARRAEALAQASS